jgi:hypothetical protein
MRTFYAITGNIRPAVSAFCPGIRAMLFFPLLLFVLTVAVSAQDVTLFQPSDAPSTPKFNDGLPLEVGLKFQSSQDGFIKGIRYYKHVGTTGIHNGHLWSSTGTKLAEAAFVGETASGWQQVLFGSAIPVTANTTYIASYHSQSGDYAATNQYFTQELLNPPLRALADGAEGPNGVYTYTTASAFPDNPGQSANYWVDVIFTTVNTPDIIPPSVSLVSPEAGETNVNYFRNITATLNEAIDPASVSGTSFQLRDAANNLVAALYTVAGNEIVLDPTSALKHSTVYTATLKGGAQGVKDVAGNALASDYSWSFTVAGLPPAEGSGGPILVLSSISNPFSRYSAEILKAQGLNEFIAKDILQVTASELSSYDVIVLGEMPITSSQAAMFTSWVNAGGTLISFRPAVELSPLLGISKFAGSLSDGYILVDTASQYGKGIVGQTIQFHGTSDLYTLNGAASLAKLYTNATTASGYPAITIRNVGSNGGRAVAFTFDLARSIIYTRQGNPAWAGQKRDGSAGPIRPGEMFVGVNSPDWVDFNKIDIPQADEQQHLLTNIIIKSNLHKKPLPKFWFLPSGHKAAIVMTGDDHRNNGTTGQFNYFKTLGPNTPADVANWKAIRGTSYIYNGTLTNQEAAAFVADGFEIGLHVNTNCQDITPFTYRNFLSQQLTSFNSQLPNVPPSITNRNHCVVWSDWATVPKVESEFGIRLDVTYYYWPGSWVQNRPGMFTGSGMPMRFADIDGSVIDCFQLPTHMTDESAINYTTFTSALLNKALGPEGYYGVFCANMHTDSSSHPGANAIIAEAIARNVPVVSARQMLKWLDGRNGSSFGPMTWSNNKLSFTITALPDALNLQTMVPFNAAYGELKTITRDGASVPFTKQTIKGIVYAFFDVPVGTGSYIATYSSPVAVPVVTLQPQTQEVCEGTTVLLTSAASGNPSPIVQWQVSPNGYFWTWSSIPGANNDTLTITASMSNSKRYYRAVWVNNAGFAVSNPAYITVNALPKLTSSLTATATSGQLFTYTPASNQNGTAFSWVREQVAGISNPTASGIGAIQEVLFNTTTAPVYVKYAYTLTSKGCSSTTNVLVMVKPVVQNDPCTTTTTITDEFNSTTIRAGRYIWFNSVMDPSNLGSTGATFKVTNSRITFSANNILYTLNVPDAIVQFSNSVAVASTQFTGGIWKTQAPLNTTGNVFLTGLSWLVPVNLPGSIKNVKWTADISIDKPGVSMNWRWGAAVYTTFASHAGLSVKPVDGLLASLGLSDKAGTPLNYKPYVVAGATGTGLIGSIFTYNFFNYTGDYSSAASVTCNSNSLLLTRGGSGQPEELQKQGVQANEETVSAFDVIAMPNPSSSSFRLNVKGSSASPVMIRVFDISGRVIEQHQKSASTVVEVGANWRGGTYLVELLQDGKRKVVKLVKIN